NSKRARVSVDAGFDPPEAALNDQHEEVTFPEDIVVGSGGKYIYLWVNNESQDTKVWFDDFTVTHSSNFVAQATDYGVWGDVLREQKSTWLDPYRFGYQGEYAEKDEETGWNHFELREYDPVIGRWTETDPKGVGFSPYVGMANNPMANIDPDGGSPFDWIQNIETRKYVFDPNVTKAEDTPEGYEYVGPSTRDVAAHFEANRSFFDYFGWTNPDIDFRGWPGEILPPNNKTIYGTVPDILTPGGAPVKGLKWLSSFKNAETAVRKIGDAWKLTAKVPGKNGSYTVYTKLVTNSGRTMRWFHDTYDKTGKFLHRGWSEGAIKFHKWWDGFLKVGKDAGPHVPR
ncbi:MAG TPA: RHS repeat-associated core domain-containing protein, partial [Chryseolinea sp.]|nr:RHS repeat-associated core domain-containing protein [Chryseolinea sp.]